MAKSFKQAPAGSVAPRPATGPDLLDWLTTGPPTSQPSAPPLEPVSNPPLPDAPVLPVQVAALLTPIGPAPIDATEPLSPRAKPASVRRKPRPTGNTPLPVPLAPAQPQQTPLGLIAASVPPAGPQATRLRRSIRQTFLVDEAGMERLRDYVHARRVAGEYDFTQKQALDEAIIEYLAARQMAPPRPETVREREQQFRHLIREGRQGKKSGDAVRE